MADFCVHILHVKKKKCALVSAPGRDANFYAALLQSDIATMR